MKAGQLVTGLPEFILIRIDSIAASDLPHADFGFFQFLPIAACAGHAENEEERHETQPENIGQQGGKHGWILAGQINPPTTDRAGTSMIPAR